MKVYIVRHGQVPHNALKQYNTKDEDLTELGIPLMRAKHTANILNVNNNKIIYNDLIRKRSCGDLSGKPVEVTNREEYWNYYTTIQYGTSENIKLFFDRVYKFLDKLKEENYESVLVVAHSGVSKAFYGYFNGIPEDGRFLNLGLKNCEIKEYDL